MFKQIAAATVMLCAVGGAYADTWDIGAVPSAPASYATSKHHFGNFTDTATFSVPEGTLGISANVLSVTDVNNPLGYAFNIAGLTYSIWQGGTQIGVDYPGGLAPTYTALLAGDYSLQISGNANGSAGGIYGLNMSVTAVPEPATYGMLAVGLGLLGLAKRRRDASNDKFM